MTATRESTLRGLVAAYDTDLAGKAVYDCNECGGMLTVSDSLGEWCVSESYIVRVAHYAGHEISAQVKPTVAATMRAIRCAAIAFELSIGDWLEHSAEELRSIGIAIQNAATEIESAEAGDDRSAARARAIEHILFVSEWLDEVKKRHTK